MYCTKCGKQIPDDTAFCGYCGEPTSPNLNSAAENELIDYEHENEQTELNNRLDDIANRVKEQQKETGKPGFKKILLIPIIAGVVVVLVVVAVLLFGDKLKPTVKKESISTEKEVQQPDLAEEIPEEVQQPDLVEQIPEVEQITEGETIPEETVSVTEPEVMELSVGDVIAFGHYESNNDMGDGSERLFWQVLAVDGDRALVITERAIDAMSFSISGTTWSDSTLRQWLNGTFAEQAFSEEEQLRILPTTIITKSNPTYGTYSGVDCTDEIFLLSGEESAIYFGADPNRQVTGSSYADANNLFISKTGYCRWWLRDAGQSDGFASVINGDGVIDYYGAPVSESRYGVRPAMWIQK